MNPSASWDQSDAVVGQMDQLNVNARPFVPNINAAVFVPSFLKQSQPPTDGATKTPEPAKLTEQPTLTDVAVESHSSAPEIDSWEDNLEETCDNKGQEQHTVVVDVVPTVEEKAVIPEEQQDDAELVPLPSAPARVPKPSKPVANIQPEDVKETVNIIFIGHVDAGKSTIGGQLLYLTGQVDKRTLEKYEREAKEKNRETWYLSWALDTNTEERDKGKTVEVGRGSFDTASKRFVLLDAPGHKSFVPNMIGGAAQADVAILVISARKGEFETGFERGGQTREHAMLAKTAGVRHLIILVNKMDEPTVCWDKSRYDEIEAKLTPFLRKTGFKASDCTFMPCSGFTGANLKDRLDPSICSWYSGPTFLDFLDNLPSFQRPIDGPVRVLVSDRYKDMGTVIIGKVESGTVCKGETYTLMPNKQTVKVVSILTHDETEKTKAKAGENMKLKLSGVEEEEVMPGFVLCSPANLCECSTHFDAQIVILEHKSIICPGYTAVMHVHNAAEEVTLTALLGTFDKKTGEQSKTRPRFIKQDTVALARFKCSELTCMETFSAFPPMGRFTLRDEGRTIAIGKIMKVLHKKEHAGGEEGAH